MNRAKALVSGCLFIASIISCVSSESLIDDIVWEADAKSIIQSGGSLYASINATTVTYVLIGVAGLIALGYILFTLSMSDGGLPFASKQSQNYYDPTTDVAADEALAYAAADLQNTNTSQEYRRKRSTLQRSKL